MWVARSHARALREALGTSGPVSGEALCAFLDVPLSFFRFAGRTPGIYWNGEVVVDPTLDARTLEDTIYHEIGHHLIHGPKGGYDFWRKRDIWMWRKMERQAREFALFAAVPSDILTLMLCDGLSTLQIARVFGRSPAWMAQRIELGRYEPELDALKMQPWVA